MLERREVDPDTVDLLIGLAVGSDQDGLVAENAVTLAEAPKVAGSRVWGLWDGSVPVGLMAMVHPHEYDRHGPGDDVNAAYLWRLMIAGEHQGKGYGQAAVAEAMAVTRGWGLSRLVATIANVGHSNMGFYERLGFRRTGRIVDSEVEIAIDMSRPGTRVRSKQSFYVKCLAACASSAALKSAVARRAARASAIRVA